MASRDNRHPQYTIEGRLEGRGEDDVGFVLDDDVPMRGAGALLISITGGDDLTLRDMDEAASSVAQRF
jgi:cell division GTPase FtsZ